MCPMMGPNPLSHWVNPLAGELPAGSSHGNPMTGIAWW